MIDEETIRSQLADFQARLTEIDEERQAILGIVKGYEALLRARTTPRDVPVTLPRQQLPLKASVPVGAVSMRSAVGRVLRSAGRPMHSRDILTEAIRLGAATNAKAPESVVSLVLTSLKKQGKVERVSPGTWQWVQARTDGDGAPM